MAKVPNNKAGRPRRQPPRAKGQPKPPLTVDAVRDALDRAAPGADELNGNLRETFELSDSSATLRLR